MKFNCNDRISLKLALQHPYFSEVPEIFKIIPEINKIKINLNEFEFDNMKLTTEQIKDMLYEEILLYHNQEFKNQYIEKLQNNQSVYDYIRNNPHSLIVYLD